MNGLRLNVLADDVTELRLGGAGVKCDTISTVDQHHECDARPLVHWPAAMLLECRLSFTPANQLTLDLG